MTDQPNHELIGDRCDHLALTTMHRFLWGSGRFTYRIVSYHRHHQQKATVSKRLTLTSNDDHRYYSTYTTVHVANHSTRYSIPLTLGPLRWWCLRGRLKGRDSDHPTHQTDRSLADMRGTTCTQRQHSSSGSISCPSDDEGFDGVKVEALHREDAPL